MLAPRKPRSASTERATLRISSRRSTPDLLLPDSSTTYAPNSSTTYTSSASRGIFLIILLTLNRTVGYGNTQVVPTGTENYDAGGAACRHSPPQAPTPSLWRGSDRLPGSSP